MSYRSCGDALQWEADHLRAELERTARYRECLVAELGMLEQRSEAVEAGARCHLWCCDDCKGRLLNPDRPRRLVTSAGVVDLNPANTLEYASKETNTKQNEGLAASVGGGA